MKSKKEKSKPYYISDLLAERLDALATDPKLSKGTFQRYRYYSATLIKHIGHTELDRLTPVALSKLYRKLMQGGASAATVRQTHSFLVRTLRLGVMYRVISNNPIEGFEFKDLSSSPVYNRVKMVSTFLKNSSAADLAEIFDNTPIGFLVRFLLSTGLRRSEALAIQVNDIHADYRGVTIDKSLHVSGKMYSLEPPKNPQSKREVLLSDEMGSGLKAYVRQLQRRSRSPLEDNSFIFPMSPIRHKQPLNPNTVSKYFSRVAQQAGFKGLRLHDCRHIHATALLSKNIAVNVVARRLGHSSPNVTFGVYGHTMVEADRAAAETAGEIFK